MHQVLTAHLASVLQTVVSDARIEPAARQKFVEAEVARWATVIQAEEACAD